MYFAALLGRTRHAPPRTSLSIMKTIKSSELPTKVLSAAQKLAPKIADAGRKAESARHRAQATKADFKLARKRFKQAKKAAKLARKELKALKELLERASQPARSKPKAKTQSAAATRKPTKSAPRPKRKKAIVPPSALLAAEIATAPAEAPVSLAPPVQPESASS
jgi:hypothetical protein